MPPPPPRRHFRPVDAAFLFTIITLVADAPFITVSRGDRSAVTFVIAPTTTGAATTTTTSSAATTSKRF